MSTQKYNYGTLQLEEIKMEWKTMYRKYAKQIKLGVFLVALAAGLGVFYWQVSLAHQADTGIWGIADAKEGDTVHKGQLLARIDADAETIQRQQAQAAQELAARDEARYAVLLQQDAVPKQTYDSYHSQMEQAQANYEAAQAAVDSAQSALTENEANQAAQDAAKSQADALQASSTRRS